MAAHLAFTEHRPLVLSPDHGWIAIAQGLARHVATRAEALRPRLVRHQGALELLVQRDDWQPGRRTCRSPSAGVTSSPRPSGTSSAGSRAIAEPRTPGAPLSDSITPAVQVAGVTVPRLIYGTAWKEAETARLVRLALSAGFRGLDTANQRKHYVEAAVGEALGAAIAAAEVARDAVFVQTKFTFRAGQDERLPYDPRAPVATQVAQSFERSLLHLGTHQIDSYVLHGPSRSEGLGPQDHAAWRAMEELHASGRARLLGVSNVSARQLDALCAFATVPPALVQNRCYAARGWDREVRAVCAARGVAYQGFSLLTANAAVWRSDTVARVAARLGRTPAQVVLRFALDSGLIVLSGTTDPRHMREVLAVLDLALEPDDLDAIGSLAPGAWTR